MSRVLRTVIACLLLVALPLQGYAAGTMLFCGGAAAGTTVLDHHHDDATAHAHDHHVAPGHDADSAAADDADRSNLHDLTHGTCSVCASCCSAAALPTAPLAASTDVPHSSSFPAFEHANPGHGPALLERPPRPHLA